MFLRAFVKFEVSCRFKNYMVAMVNKSLLPPRLQIPLLGEVVFLTHGLKYNLELLLFCKYCTFNECCNIVHFTWMQSSSSPMLKPHTEAFLFSTHAKVHNESSFRINTCGLLQGVHGHLLKTVGISKRIIGKLPSAMI